MSKKIIFGKKLTFLNSQAGGQILTGTINLHVLLFPKPTLVKITAADVRSDHNTASFKDNGIIISCYLRVIRLLNRFWKVWS